MHDPELRRDDGPCGGIPFEIDQELPHGLPPRIGEECRDPSGALLVRQLQDAEELGTRVRTDRIEPPAQLPLDRKTSLRVHRMTVTSPIGRHNPLVAPRTENETSDLGGSGSPEIYSG